MSIVVYGNIKLSECVLDTSILMKCPRLQQLTWHSLGEVNCSDIKGNLRAFLPDNMEDFFQPKDDSANGFIERFQGTQWNRWNWYTCEELGAIVDYRLVELIVGVCSESTVFHRLTMHQIAGLFKLNEISQDKWVKSAQAEWKFYTDAAIARIESVIDENMESPIFKRHASYKDLIKSGNARSQLFREARLNKYVEGAMSKLWVIIADKLSQEQNKVGPVNITDLHMYLQFESGQVVRQVFWVDILRARKIDKVPSLNEPDAECHIYGTPALLCYYIYRGYMGSDFPESKISILLKRFFGFDTESLEGYESKLWDNMITQAKICWDPLVATISFAKNTLSPTETLEHLQFKKILFNFEMAFVNLFRRIDEYKDIFKRSDGSTPAVVQEFMDIKGNALYGHEGEKKDMKPWWLLNHLLKEANLRRNSDRTTGTWSLQKPDNTYKQRKNR